MLLLRSVFGEIEREYVGRELTPRFPRDLEEARVRAVSK